MKLIEKIYQQAVCPRADDHGAVFYFSAEDFEGLQKEAFSFPSADGHILQGYFYFYEQYKPNHMVVFDHGMGSGHRGYMKEIELLAREGYRVFSYDHTGCMESGGESTGGFPQSLKDLNDALSALKAAYPDHTFSVVGHSWGAFSTLNIAAFHPDVKHLVAMAGFVSVERVLKQFFGFLSKGLYRKVLEKEPKFAAVSAEESLKKTDAKVLIIHSEDDPTVRCDQHFDPLQAALKDQKNITFLKVSGKRHNPNYTADAVVYKDEFFKIYQKAMKKGLNTPEEKEAFKASFDWDRMTEQDLSLWAIIFETLKS